MSLDLQITHNFEPQIAQLKQAPEIIQKHLVSAVRRSLVIVESKVLPKIPIGATKQLYNSMGSEVMALSQLHIRGTFGSSLSVAYPQWVESGRPPKATQRLSADDLLPWVTRKLGLSGKEAARAAFLIARKISLEGFEGQFFMKDGVLQSKPGIEKEFMGIRDDVIAELEI